ncbi:hypothetical protein [Streptosporangium sp. KLBMP 9127]
MFPIGPGISRSTRHPTARGASPNLESNGQIRRFKVTDIAWKID